MQRLQRQHGTFARYMWSFLPQGRPIVNGFTCAANFAQAQPFCEMHAIYRAANGKAVNGMCALTSCVGIHLHLHETGRSALARICIIQGLAPDCMHSKREKMGCIASACRLQSQKPVTSDKAAEISAALKKEGFKFVGPIMMYEVMKVCHVQTCFNSNMCNVRCDCLCTPQCNLSACHCLLWSTYKPDSHTIRQYILLVCGCCSHVCSS